ncbi:MAG: hypothetical protein RR382_13690, partial [Tannerellaceae bacterium]
MSKDMDGIRRAFDEKYGGGNKDTVFQAIVTVVNEKEFTCEVIQDDASTYFDVRLRGLVNSSLKGIAFIPVIGSTVLVCRIRNSNECFVCQFTEVDKLILTSGDISLMCDPDKIELLKGDKLSVLINAESITMKANQATIKATTGGLTLTKGGSGLKKTLDDLLKAIQKLTVTT